MRYSDFFLREFIPLIESKYRISKGRRNRAISGISMGGYGALRFAFAHPEMFSAVSAQSAALMTESPQELDTAAKSGAPMGKLLATVFGSPIDVAHWKENSPLALASRNQAALRRLAIYFNCGQDDNYGFEKGAAALHEQLLKESRARVSCLPWRSQPRLFPVPLHRGHGVSFPGHSVFAKHLR